MSAIAALKGAHPTRSRAHYTRKHTPGQIGPRALLLSAQADTAPQLGAE